MSTFRLKIAYIVTFLPMAALAGAPGDLDSGSGNPVVTLATGLGDVILEIFAARAPGSSESFLRYVDAGLYENAGFYRVVSPENDNGEPVISVIQGGLLDDDKALSPVALETTEMTGVLHQDGAISLARGAPDSGSGAAFFICIGAQPALDFGGQRNADGLGFAAFGRVIAGMDVVRKIHAQNADGPSDSPYTQGQMLARPVVILRAYRHGESTGLK